MSEEHYCPVCEEAFHKLVEMVKTKEGYKCSDPDCNFVIKQNGKPLIINFCKQAKISCKRASEKGYCKDKEIIEYGCFRFDGKVIDSSEHLT